MAWHPKLPWSRARARRAPLTEQAPAQGLTNAAIAGRLYVSGKTVRNHVSNVMTRIQAADRAEAIVRAREAGLGRSDLDSR